jgi:RNA polymerase sigma-70 factor (ECF subfamily)
MAWLYRTCTRVAIDLLRERRRTSPLALAIEDAGRAEPCGADLTGAIEARSALARIVGDAPDDELTAAMLCRVDGLTHPEAAEVLNVSERTVRRLLDRFDERVAALRNEHAS